MDLFSYVDSSLHSAKKVEDLNTSPIEDFCLHNTRVDSKATLIPNEILSYQTSYADAESFKKPCHLTTVESAKPSSLDAMLLSSLEVSYDLKKLKIASEDVALFGIDSNAKQTQQMSKARITKYVKKKEYFKCLAIRVGGLKLALPIDEVNKLYPWQSKLTGQLRVPKYCLGWVNLHKKRRLILDILAVFEKEKTTSSPQPFNYILNLQQAPWSIACHELLGVFELDEQSIHWRKQANHWGVLGIEKQKMCTILSANRLVAKLKGEVDLDVL